ncbi:hypothetical protein [Streptomyces sp. NRRL S-337]|uniref:hypothetical protein n=1 Tax=Streptomyces sp. NRRL S-337 TaxID=1463900 RepID=UPI00131AE494|nr:hypothetical protein [Streptomyces sp. NRRL S-337]
MTDLELLARFPSAGADHPVTNDWPSAEKTLHTSFPAPFKEFLDVFGGAKFDDFLRVYRAGAQNENVDLIRRSIAARATMANSRPHIRSLLAGRGVTPSELIRWGGTDNADMLFLVPHPDPDNWAVLTVTGRGQEYDVYEGPAESYLLRILRRELTSQVLPDDFPDEEFLIERAPWI